MTYGSVGGDRSVLGGALELEQRECGELHGGGRVVRAELRVGEVGLQALVGVAGGAADADLHQAGGAGGVGDAGAGRAGLQRAGRVGAPAEVALVGGDPGEHLPRDVVLGADLLEDREQLARDLRDRSLGRGVGDTGKAQAGGGAAGDGADQQDRCDRRSEDEREPAQRPPTSTAHSLPLRELVDEPSAA